MALRKHLRYAEGHNFPRSQFVGSVSSQLQTLQRYQCQGCGCLDPHDHNHGAAGEYHAFTEESAFEEASRRAASRRASAMHFDQKAGWQTGVPAVWNCGLLAPEWPRPVSKEPAIPKWVENVSDYGTWSDSEPTTIVYPQGKSLVMLPPPKRCTRCVSEVAQVDSENKRRPPEHPTLANWYPCRPTVKEVHARCNEEVRRRPNSGPRTTSLFNNQKLSIVLNTTNEGRSDHQSNTGPSTPRMRMKTQSAEETTSDGEATARRPPSRPRRPHSAAPRTQLPNENCRETPTRVVKRSASATTIPSDVLIGSRRRSSATPKNTSRRLKEKIRNREGRTQYGQRPGTPAGRTGDERETKSWQGEGTAEESEGAGWPTSSSGDRTYRREEKPDATGQDSSQANVTGTPQRASPRPPTRVRPKSPRGSSDPDQEKPTEKQITANRSEAEKFGNPEVTPKPEQEKPRTHNEEVDRTKSLRRPTIEDCCDSRSEESISPFLSRALAPYGVESIFPGPGSKDVQDAMPSTTDETKELRRSGAGDSHEARQNATVTPAAAEANVPARKSNAASAEDAVINVDFQKCIEVILNSTTGEVSRISNGENSSGGQAKNDFKGIKQLTAEVTEQIVQAPDGRGQANHSVNSTRDLTVANSSLSTTLSSEVAASTGNSSSSHDAKGYSERRRKRSITKGRNRSAASIHSHHKITSVVNWQLKQVRIGVDQLENLIKLQRLLEEDISELKTQNQPE